MHHKLSLCCQKLHQYPQPLFLALSDAMRKYPDKFADAYQMSKRRPASCRGWMDVALIVVNFLCHQLKSQDL